MKKYKKISISLIILMFLLIGGIVLFIFKKPVIMGRLYSGDHISINLTIFLDGKLITLEDINANCQFENNICEVTSDSGIYKTEGGKYGKYQFEIIIPKERLAGCEEDLIVNLDYINANSWYISKSDCIINLYTGNLDRLTGEATVEVKYNDNTTLENKYDLKISDYTININWGI